MMNLEGILKVQNGFTCHCVRRS